MNQELLERLHGSTDPEDLLSKIGIEQPPVDVDAVASEMGLRVSGEFNFEKLSHSGEINWSADRETAEIWINPTDSRLRQRFTLAHELGHFLCHMLPARQDPHESERFVDGGVQFRRGARNCPVETEANAFAASLLMPESMVFRAVKTIVDANKTDDNRVSLSRERFIELLAEQFSVSSQAMKWRLVNLGVISK